MWNSRETEYSHTSEHNDKGRNLGQSEDFYNNNNNDNHFQKVCCCSFYRPAPPSGNWERSSQLSVRGSRVRTVSTGFQHGCSENSSWWRSRKRTLMPSQKHPLRFEYTLTGCLNVALSCLAEEMHVCWYIMCCTATHLKPLYCSSSSASTLSC